MKYSKAFKRDWFYYLTHWRLFTFSGNPFDYSHGRNVISDPLGKSAKEAFLLYDAQGKVVPCRQAPLLKVILKAKSSLSLHIQMYAQDRAKGYLPRQLFKKEIHPIIPDWAIKAVENQKGKYYD